MSPCHVPMQTSSCSVPMQRPYAIPMKNPHAMSPCNVPMQCPYAASPCNVPVQCPYAMSPPCNVLMQHLYAVSLCNPHAKSPRNVPMHPPTANPHETLCHPHLAVPVSPGRCWRPRPGGHCVPDSLRGGGPAQRPCPPAAGQPRAATSGVSPSPPHVPMSPPCVFNAPVSPSGPMGIFVHPSRVPCGVPLSVFASHWCPHAPMSPSPGSGPHPLPPHPSHICHVPHAPMSPMSSCPHISPCSPYVPMSLSVPPCPLCPQCLPRPPMFPCPPMSQCPHIPCPAAIGQGTVPGIHLPAGPRGDAGDLWDGHHGLRAGTGGHQPPRATTCCGALASPGPHRPR